ncbi:J domain-containing protein [Sphingomonas sp. HITSZ_GF]|uniref:J domain-containing protein n=1 Tax=Sphingomonas sp. HITSZ_GF TaxID=3037247 RepID=UPI00240D5E25|nr:J domain-containing protein [Sphingomonas sp. HITSZ_GF]MDG2535749.1 J domain-containing protein [Sphingomonas sp. HITSZ_GF]
MPGPNNIDPYAVLGLSPKADDVVIRAAWKALMRKYHPDASTAPDAAEQAARINAAFKLLITPEARAAYDRSRNPPPSAPVPRPRPATAWKAAAPRTGFAAKTAKWRLRRRRRDLAIAAFVVTLAGGLAFYVARNDLPFPAPVQRLVDGIITNPTVAQARDNARRLLGLDAPIVAATTSGTPAGRNGPPPDIDEAAITATVEQFAALAAQDSAAAVVEGRKCAGAQQASGWAALDGCTAIDIAGLASAKGMFTAPDPGAAYFEQAALTLPERYASVSSDAALVAARIDRIRALVLATMLDKFEARVGEQPPSARLPTGE